MSLFKPEYVWLATGSKQGFKYEMLKPLKGFKIIAFPDKSEYTHWQNRAMELKDFGFAISVSNYLEDTAHMDGTDLADLYIDLLKTSGDLGNVNKQISGLILTSEEHLAMKMIKVNPTLQKLITDFDLTDGNGNSIRVAEIKNH